MFPNDAFEAEGVSVASGVSDQPMNDAETFQGAWNRVERVFQELPEADFWVGIEGGIEKKDEETEAFAWIVVRAKNGMWGKGKTGTFFLPRAVVELVRQGMELGEANDRVFGHTNSKQKNGAVGLLTKDIIDRTAFYTHAVVLALIPFKNETLYLSH